jgi:hypothetical protein
VPRRWLRPHARGCKRFSRKTPNCFPTEKLDCGEKRTAFRSWGCGWTLSSCEKSVYWCAIDSHGPVVRRHARERRALEGNMISSEPRGLPVLNQFNKGAHTAPLLPRCQSKKQGSPRIKRLGGRRHQTNSLAPGTSAGHQARTLELT